jgi:hypothetical protein
VSNSGSNSAQTTPTSAQTILGTSTSTSSNHATFSVPHHAAAAPSKSASRKELEAAVYNYIRAVRALGRDTIDLIDIAKALSLSINEVQSTLPALKEKGVKIA